MKRSIILTWLMLAVAFTASAAESGVFMEFHRKSKPGTSTKVHRTPMHIPVEVTYDSDTRTVKIVGDESIIAVVYLYDKYGNLIESTDSINTVLYVPESIGSLINIRIESENWYATANIII